ncbi:MAG: hypothetical protein HYT47_02475 [Candidatus Vogelbacteria bacterium]|nr:hypothetical protein [Candidatus Vogelbacteria bacterium]
MLALLKQWVVAFLITTAIFVMGYGHYAYSEAEILTVTVSTTLSFSASTDNFGSLSAGTAKFATTTLNVNTNNTAGNAVRISALDNSGDVLAFRVMTASGSVPFRAATWWGSADNYADSVSTLWAGVASSTIQRQVGNAGTGSYSASDHLNTVLYYLDVPATQQSGAYSCPLTFTATAN